MHAKLEARVAAHYSNPGVLKAILNGLKQAGCNPEAPSAEDLAPVDEFHTAGRITTLKALAMTPIDADMHVLDAGCGIGGTARCLAKEKGCRVTGIDLTPDYIDVAHALTERTGLSDVCAFHHASVLDMPFADGSFDAAVTFHVAMNIDNRAQFYGELARVSRQGAPLCMFDVMKGPTAGMHFPVPWAETEANSFLRTPNETCDLVKEAGFDIVAKTSLREFAIDFFRDAFAKAAKLERPPPLGLHILTGTNAPDKFANYAKALDEHQIDPVIVVAKRH
jgi:ubiquinone/menaquinone biosynthesis C-methylase UbiE